MDVPAWELRLRQTWLDAGDDSEHVQVTARDLEEALAQLDELRRVNANQEQNLATVIRALERKMAG